MKLTTWLSFVFFLSGLSALVYQVVWQRILTLYYGVGPISTTLIVSIYMAGLGLGALAGGFLAEKLKKKIEAYALIELFIGGFGFISLAFLDLLGRYTAGASYVLSFVCMALFLLIPTFLMGTTLPLLTKIFNHYIHNFSKTVSSLYFINTIGAAVGALVASYILISFWGMDIAVYVAAAVNFVLALGIFLLTRRRNKVEQAEMSASDSRDENSGLGRWVYALVFLTGFLAIGYEIVWFRVIGVMVKGSPYAFSSILFVYLLGIALGSLGMGWWLDRHPKSDKRNLFFLYQFLIAVSAAVIFLTYYHLTRSTSFGQLTYLSFRVQDHPMYMFGEQFSGEPLWLKLYALLDVFWWSFFFVLIPTWFMGASFPLITRLALVEKNREGRTIARVYFYNILGNVLGGILTGFFFLHSWGTEITVMIFVFIGLFFGFRVYSVGKFSVPLAFRAGSFLIVTALIFQFFPKQADIYRLMHSFNRKELLNAQIEEGVDGVVATYHNDQETVNFINGTTQGGRPAYMFYALTAESISFVPNIKNVLVIGFGTGGVVEAALKASTVEKVTIVELSETLIDNLKKNPFFENILSDPRVELVIDDGRRFLLRSDQKFDLIVSFLVRSSTAYSNNIYSLEFFELVKKRLTPSGILLVWAHDNSIIARTMATAFPHLNLYSRGSNIFCIASPGPLKQNLGIKKFIVKQFLPREQELIIGSFPDLSAQRSQILALTSQLRINRDLKPICEFYIGEVIRLNRLQHK